MYSITTRSSGFILKFKGNVSYEEMINWFQESEVLVQLAKPGFGVIVDMAELKPLDPKTQELMVKGQGMYREAGMNRSAVILSNPILRLQFARLAKQSSIFDSERYFDGSAPGAVEKAIKWVKKGICEEVGEAA